MAARCRLIEAKRTKEQLIEAQREAIDARERDYDIYDQAVPAAMRGDVACALEALALQAGQLWKQSTLAAFDLKGVDEQGHLLADGWLALPAGPDARKCLAVTAPGIQCQEPATHARHEQESPRCSAHAPEGYLPSKGCVTWTAGSHLDNLLAIGAATVTTKARQALEQTAPLPENIAAAVSVLKPGELLVLEVPWWKLDDAARERLLSGMAAAKAPAVLVASPVKRESVEHLRGALREVGFDVVPLAEEKIVCRCSRAVAKGDAFATDAGWRCGVCVAAEAHDALQAIARLLDIRCGGDVAKVVPVAVERALAAPDRAHRILVLEATPQHTPGALVVRLPSGREVTLEHGKRALVEQVVRQAVERGASKEEVLSDVAVVVDEVAPFRLEDLEAVLKRARARVDANKVERFADARPTTSAPREASQGKPRWTPVLDARAAHEQASATYACGKCGADVPASCGEPMTLHLHRDGQELTAPVCDACVQLLGDCSGWTIREGRIVPEEAESRLTPAFTTFADLLAAGKPARVFVLEESYGQQAYLLDHLRKLGGAQGGAEHTVVTFQGGIEVTLFYESKVYGMRCDVAVGFAPDTARHVLDGSPVRLAVLASEAARFWGMA